MYCLFLHILTYAFLWTELTIIITRGTKTLQPLMCMREYFVRFQVNFVVLPVKTSNSLSTKDFFSLNHYVLFSIFVCLLLAVAVISCVTLKKLALVG